MRFLDTSRYPWTIWCVVFLNPDSPANLCCSQTSQCCYILARGQSPKKSISVKSTDQRTSLEWKSSDSILKWPRRAMAHRAFARLQNLAESTCALRCVGLGRLFGASVAVDWGIPGQNWVEDDFSPARHTILRDSSSVFRSNWFQTLPIERLWVKCLTMVRFDCCFLYPGLPGCSDFDGMRKFENPVCFEDLKQNAYLELRQKSRIYSLACGYIARQKSVYISGCCSNL